MYCPLCAFVLLSRPCAALSPQVSLMQCQGSMVGGLALFEGLCANSTLEKLTLGGNTLSGAEGGAAIAAALSAPTCGLKILSLQQCGALNDDAFKLIAEALKKNTSLRSIDIGMSGLGQGGFAAFADAFKENATLTHFESKYNGSVGDLWNTIKEAFLASKALPARKEDLRVDIDGVSYPRDL